VVKLKTDINFMGKRKIAFAFSLTLVIISIIALATRGLSLGLDFTGGTLVEMEYKNPPNLPQVRSLLSDAGYKHFVVQNFGSERSVLVRLSKGFNDKIGEQVVSVLSKDGAGVQLKRAEFVGSQVGDELREQGGLGLLLALAVVMVYVAMRFQLKFSLGAVLALIHDVTITMGMFALFQWTFDLTVLAAILAVIGYSLNDTIIVYDRIRENFRKFRKEGAERIINISLNQTLSRTLMTSFTTILVLLALFFFGGESVNGFAKALLIGVFIGTYSSIYVASNLLMYLKVSRDDLLVPVKEGQEVDERP
jgi:preprotein translocase subunit SecF